MVARAASWSHCHHSQEAQEKLSYSASFLPFYSVRISIPHHGAAHSVRSLLGYPSLGRPSDFQKFVFQVILNSVMLAVTGPCDK